MPLEASAVPVDPPDWGVAIISSRERLADLEACLAAVRAACVGHRVTVDVVVNGNRELAEQIATRVGPAQAGAFEVRVWFLQFGDKAHAWNEYVQCLAPACRHAFFVDGYVRVKPDALRLLVEGLAETPGALAASAAPSMGRSAASLRRAMLASGGIHGNLHVLRRDAMQRLRACGFRLPLGLYRVDSTVGAALCFNLDPAVHEWVSRRIFVHPAATWDLPTAEPRSVAFWYGQYKRRLRQAQGDFENAAVRDHFSLRRQKLESLPATASALVGAWVARDPTTSRRLMLANPLRWWAWRKLRQPRDWSAAAIPPLWLNPPASE